MKIYRSPQGIFIEHQNALYQHESNDWDTLFNSENLLDNLSQQVATLPAAKLSIEQLLEQASIPMQSQELWASGVTYFRSKKGRQEEASAAGGGDFYQRVYEAERPELFFKASAHRVAGQGENIRIRADSSWDVPEPELVLAINREGKIIGYTIGNDVSSRSIEGENPLYLPQAKTYDGCAALGPGILLSNSPLADNTAIHLDIVRAGASVIKDSIEINQITRKFEDLVEFLYRESSFPHGAFLMTGTGIVPSSDFSLQAGDTVHISIDAIGTLSNTVGE